MDTIADRLKALHDRVPDPSTGKPFTYRAMSHVLAERGHEISAPYLSQLFTGSRTSPSFSTVRALAGFYGVSLAYFDLADNETPRSVLQQLDMLAIARDQRFKQIMARGATQTDRQELIQALLEAIEEANRDDSPESS